MYLPNVHATPPSATTITYYNYQKQIFSRRMPQSTGRTVHYEIPNKESQM